MSTIAESVEKRITVHLDDHDSNGNGRLSALPMNPAEMNGRASGHRQKTLAMFSYENPDTVVGRFVSAVAATVAKRNISVHIFSRSPFKSECPHVHTHAVGECHDLDLFGQVHEFTRRAANAYLKQFHASQAAVTIMGHEWSAVPAISLLHGIKNVGTMLSLQSLERQRSGAVEDLGRRIEEIELAGLRESSAVFVHNPETSELARKWMGNSGAHILDASPMIPLHQFDGNIDAGQVKGRYHVGPIDPTVVFVGDLCDQYGPDLLMKAMPRVLERHPQARCVFVGDGDLMWPLRVYSRYLLLDHAVRIVGDLQKEPLYELIQAADIIAVPSRTSTPWWPILAAWAADRPVVATNEAASPLLEHQHDSVLVQPDEQSLAWGIDSLLGDSDLMAKIAKNGYRKLDQRCNWNTVAAQIDELMRVQQSQQVAMASCD